VWRPGIDVDRAIAVHAMVVSLDSLDAATREYGWSPDEVETWWFTTLTGLLLK